MFAVSFIELALGLVLAIVPPMSVLSIYLPVLALPALSVVVARTTRLVLIRAWSFGSRGCFRMGSPPLGVRILERYFNSEMAQIVIVAWW